MRSDYITSKVLLVLGFWTCSTFSHEGSRGQITLRNNCPFSLYIEGVSRDTYLKTMIQPDGLISQPFRLTVNGTGSSLKIATRQGSLDISQVEYSACFGEPNGIECYPPNQIFYDLSKINAQSKSEYGVRITPSFPQCVSIECPAGPRKCDLVYYVPGDNYATKACDVRTDLDVELCPV